LSRFVSEVSTVQIVVTGADPELQTNAKAFCNAYTILNIFLGTLGTAFAFVQSDISYKLQNIQEHNEKRGGSLTLEGIVLAEMNENTIRTPTSAGRNLLRLVRALEFVTQLFERLDKKQELVFCATEAYNQTLKPHHTWVVRTMVSVAFKTLPYRTDFLQSIGLNPDEENFTEVNKNIKPLGENLQKFYERHKITDLL